jgi:hypothetical protein
MSQPSLDPHEFAVRTPSETLLVSCYQPPNEWAVCERCHTCSRDLTCAVPRRFAEHCWGYNPSTAEAMTRALQELIPKETAHGQ